MGSRCFPVTMWLRSSSSVSLSSALSHRVASWVESPEGAKIVNCSELAETSLLRKTKKREKKRSTSRCAVTFLETEKTSGSRRPPGPRCSSGSCSAGMSPALGMTRALSPGPSNTSHLDKETKRRRDVLMILDAVILSVCHPRDNCQSPISGPELAIILGSDSDFPDRGNFLGAHLRVSGQ